MNKSFLVVAMVVMAQMGWAAHRPGITLRMTGELVDPDYQGERDEFRLMSDGTELFGFCKGSPATCTLKEIGRLSPNWMGAIEREISRAGRIRPIRWTADLNCFKAPDFQMVFTASNGEVLLRNGDECLGGGLYNPSKAALRLIQYIQNQLPLKLH